MEPGYIITSILLSLAAVFLWELLRLLYRYSFQWIITKYRNNIFRILQNETLICKSIVKGKTIFVRQSDIVTGDLIREKLPGSATLVDVPSANYSDLPAQDLIVIGSTKYNDLATFIQKKYSLNYEFVYDSHELEPEEKMLRIIGRFGIRYTSSVDLKKNDLELEYDYAILFVANRNEKRIIWIAGIHGVGTIGVMKFLSSKESLDFSSMDLNKSDANLWLFRVLYNRQTEDSLEMVESVELLDGPRRCEPRAIKKVPKALICDMGNVLFYFNRSRAHRSIAHYYGVSIPKVEAVIESSGLRLKYEAGQMSTEQFNQKIRDGLKIKKRTMPLKNFVEVWGDIFWPNASMIQAIKELRNQGITLLLCSNTNEAHFSFLKEHYSDVLNLFEDNLILSYQENVLKPDQKIFDASRALLGSGYHSNDCLFVDDINEYVDAAIQSGMQGVVYYSYVHFVVRLRQFGLYIS